MMNKKRVFVMIVFLKRFGAVSLPLFFAAFLMTLSADEERPASVLTADLHKNNGVSCEGCHGAEETKTFVPSERCLACHGDRSGLVKKTAAVKPENPHDSPHWGSRMECNVCHRQHEKTVDWCSHCHAFNFKTP
jgi:RecJ-like exonuclease